MSRLAPPRMRPTARSERGPRAGGATPIAAGHAGPFGVPVQAKMTVGPARDRFEAEADRAADHVLSGAPGVPSITPLGAAPAMRMPAPEEDTAQRAVKDEAEDLQRQVDDEEEEAMQLQRQVDDEEEEAMQLQRQVGEEEEETVQMEAAGAARTASASVESGIRSARGSGQPLPAETRGRMEQGFGRDFSGVRIHDDSRAARLNSDINARAFTTGSDIFFSRGAYAPGTTAGDRLLAHELTHVAQQTGPGRVQTERVQRNGNPPATQTQTGGSSGNPPAAQPAPIGPVFTDPAGQTIDTRPSKMLFTLNHVQLPEIAGLTKGVTAGVTSNVMPATNFTWTGKGDRSATDDPGFEGSPAQVELWERPLRTETRIENALKAKGQDIGVKAAGQPVYFFRHTGARRNSVTYIGTIPQLMKQRDILRPPFSKGKDAVFHDVDHYWEIQLGGRHSKDNLWLLTQEANRSSGTQIKTKNVAAAEALAKKADDAGFWAESGKPARPSFTGSNGPTWPDSTKVNLKFNAVQTFGINGSGWTLDEISKGTHIEQLEAIDKQKLIKDGLIPKTDQNNNPVRPDILMVFASPTSAFRKILGVKDDDTLDLGRDPDGFIDGFSISSTSYAANLNPTADQEIGSIPAKHCEQNQSTRRYLRRRAKRIRIEDSQQKGSSICSFSSSPL